MLWPQKAHPLAGKTICDGPGTAPMIELDLATRPVEKAVVIESLEATQGLLLAPVDQGFERTGAKKLVLVDMTKDFLITVGDPHRRGVW